MALRGKAPSKVQKRLKAFLFGEAGMGKTTAAIQFPRPYLIDTEKGSENEEYVETLERVGGCYFGVDEGAGDLDEVIKEVQSLMTEKHDYATLIIDPLTVPYNDAADRSADELGTEFGRHKIPVDRKIRHLCNLIMRLDMNVIITAHAKAKWTRGKDAKGKDVVQQEGFTFDCYSKLDYIFDFAFQLQRDGDRVMGLVTKTRSSSFPRMSVFPFSYDEVADRYGREILERETETEELAAPESITELLRLIALLGWPEDNETTEPTDGSKKAVKRSGWRTWLTKGKAENWEEMTAESVLKCVAFLRSEITKAEVA